MSRQKGFIPISVVLVSLIILGLIGGVYYFGRQNNQQGNQSSPTPISTNSITIEGKIVCLSNKDTSGPQTFECAIGLKGNDGKNYGLKNLSQQDLISGKFPTGSRVKVTGRFEKTDINEKYDILENIDISSITEL